MTALFYLNWDGVFETDAGASYVNRLLSVSRSAPIEDRFFLWATDELLLDMEEQAFQEEGDRLQNYLIGLYQGWRAALSDEEWANVERRNESQGGANKNSLLDYIV